MTIVYLEDGTMGRVQSSFYLGKTATVELHDENGMPIEVTGKIVEVVYEGE